MQIQPLILAAGKGTRMRSRKPKVLQPLGGKPMLEHVIHTCMRLEDAVEPVIVIGFGADLIRESMNSMHAQASFVIQEQQLGTGHAVQVAADEIDDQATVVVLYGDVPLISEKTIQQVCEIANRGALGLLTVVMDNPQGYGRIVRDSQGKVQAIVEQRDAGAEQLQIREINTGVLALKGAKLKALVARISAENAQNEYYLTDIIEMAVSDGISVEVAQPENAYEVVGVNDRQQLAELEAIYQKLAVNSLMAQGGTFAQPESVEILGEVSLGMDVYIGRNVQLNGQIELGDDVRIESNCIITDSQIASGAHIRPFSHLEGAKVGDSAIIGPYARLREGSNIGTRAKVGNFVETKNIQMGEGSKANHLTYLGDTDLGQGVNVGAGTITCNYDGKNKHRTQIQDEAFIGSNSALVAPVSIGKGATVAAGAVITRDVGDNELALTRAPQKHLSGWKRPEQK